MKIFLDSADYEAIKQWASTRLIDGVTTNPTLLSKVPGKEPRELILALCDVMGARDVSVEVTQREPRAVYEQARKIAALASNIVVKVPCLKEYVPIIDKLVSEGIKLNITLVFSAVQALMMAKLGVAYVSPFIGRLEDIDSNGLELIADIRDIFSEYDYKTQILAASIRSVRHIHEVALLGADIATIPVKLFNKSLDHPLSMQGLNQFLSDWQETNISLFP